MAYATVEARRELLETLAVATEDLAFALACLTEAYEKLDEHNGERLEGAVFRPVQVAFGRAKRTHSEFAERHRLPGRSFAEPPPGVHPSGAPGFVGQAADAVEQADGTLAALQDSMLPVEAGDELLRAGLSAVRDAVGAVPERSRELLRTLGR